MSARIYYLDIVNGVLVTPANTNAASRIRPFGQDDVSELSIYPVVPVVDQASPYQAADLSTSNMSVALCGGAGKPTGTHGTGASSPVEIARNDLVWDGDHFTGTLDCTRDDFATFLGVLDKKPTVFEIRLTGPSGSVERYRFAVTAEASVIETASTGPLSRARVIPPVLVTIPDGQNQSAPIVVPYIHATDLPLYTDPRVMTLSINVNEDDETLSTLTAKLVTGVAAGDLTCYALIFFNP